MTTPMPPVASLWIGESLSVYEQLCLRSFVRTGHPVTLHVYEDVAGVPEGVTVCDASLVLPRTSVFPNPESSTYAMFANWFRYEMVQATGHTWIDADLVSIGGPLPQQEYLYAFEDASHLNNALFSAPQDSPLLRELLSATRRLEDPAARDVPWGTYGPRVLTDSVTALGLLDHALTPERVYPIHFSEMWRLFDPTARSRAWCAERTGSALTIHLWNQVLRSAGQKDRHPHPDAFLGRVMRDLDLPVTGPSVDAARLRPPRATIARRLRRRLGRLGLRRRGSRGADTT